jgi:uncharacterized protein
MSTVLQLGTAVSMPNFPPDILADFQESWQPDATAVAWETAVYQGNWLEQMSHRVPASIEMQTFSFLFWGSWRAGGLMLMGMALFKLGVLTAQRSEKFYRNLLMVGFGAGFPLILLGLSRNWAAGWSMAYSRFVGSQFNYWGSLGVSLGYIGIIMLIAKSGRFESVLRPFAAVGRTALSNYLFQTIAATVIFYGYGLGLFGQVERIGQLLIVFGIWSVQLVVSPIWLRYFRFGPAEWLWRSLTYGQRQTIQNRALPQQV